jgi:hypothetical protein
MRLLSELQIMALLALSSNIGSSVSGEIGSRIFFWCCLWSISYRYIVVIAPSSHVLRGERECHIELMVYVAAW